MLALKAFDNGIFIGNYSGIRCKHEAGIALDSDTIREALLTGLLTYCGVANTYNHPTARDGHRRRHTLAAHYINFIDGCETFHIIQPEDGTFIGTVSVRSYNNDSVAVNDIKGVALLTSNRAQA